MARKTVYEMLFSFEAPDIIKSENSGKVVTQFFEEGEEVVAEVGEYHSHNTHRLNEDELTKLLLNLGEIKDVIKEV